MNGQPTEIVTPAFTFARVQSGLDLYPERPRGFPDGSGAADTTGWPIERDQKPVSGLLDFSASNPTDLLAHGTIVGVQDGSPPLISEGCGSLRGSNDVREEDRRQYPINIIRRALAS